MFGNVRASNAFAKVRSGAMRLAPVTHAAARVARVAQKVASLPVVESLPGAGLVRGIARGVETADRVVSALAKKGAPA